MSVQSTNVIAGGGAQPSGFVPTPLGSPRQTVSPAVKLPAPAAVKPATTPEQLKQAVAEANEVFRQVQSDVQFVVDDESNKVVIKLVEPGSGEVINQYPTEQAVAISKAIAQTQSNIAEKHAAFKSADSGLTGLIVKHKT